MHPYFRLRTPFPPSEIKPCPVNKTHSSPISFSYLAPGIRLNASQLIMRLSATTLLVALLGWITATAAHTIQLKAHSRECFHEMLHRDDKMTVSFQVGDREFGGSGNLEIDFWVRLPCATSWIAGDTSIDAAICQNMRERNADPASCCCRSRIPAKIASTSSRPSPPKTTPSRRTGTANTSIASATRVGRRARKRFPSTFMGLSTCRNPSTPRTRWIQKVYACIREHPAVMANLSSTISAPTLRRPGPG